MKSFFFAVLFAFIQTPVVFATPVPNNAKAFLSEKTRLLPEGGEGGSGGMGNGGLELGADFFKQAVIGLRYLALTKRLSDEQIKKISQAMDPPTRVFPVEFQLCDRDDDTSCSDSSAYVAKNYPDQKIILVDSRDQSHKWRTLSLLAKRMIAVHEFSGIAGIESGNYRYSSEIDEGSGIDEKAVFNDFKSQSETHRYFKMMNDLYFKLPGVPDERFDGTWYKKTILMPLSREHVQTEDALLHGAKSKLVIFHSEAGLRVETYNDRFKHSGEWGYSNTATEITKIQESPCEHARIADGELWCSTPYQTDRYWRGKYKRIFKPSFGTSLKRNSPVAEFSCKALSENELICRHVYWQKVEPFPIPAFETHYEFVFYRK